MADDIVIRAEGLGKKYTIGHQSKRERYTALRDVMARGARNLWRKTADLARGRAVVAGDRVEEFWALKDVSFEVRRGEVLGIIGRNGAGKSTLLKILSRITEPSEGRVTIKGRVASLLEVGTGFHPELTGRENIYLNGAILGMTRAEIRRKFDEIVDFAGVEKFLDTPVKRYSSGMYVRLAFAVAAHLEPEILVIDEVLAVGDAEFQKKCLGKMGEVAGGGRTVLFVSHHMGSVARLCSRVVALGNGRIIRSGMPDETIWHYLHAGSEICRRRLSIRSCEHPFTLHEVEILDTEGASVSVLGNNQPFRVRLIYELSAPIYQLRVGFRLHAADGTVVLTSTDWDCRGGENGARRPGTYVSCVELPAGLLNRGHYYVGVGADIPMVKTVLMVDSAASFSIEPTEG